jgi:hypothetical protein
LIPTFWTLPGTKAITVHFPEEVRRQFKAMREFPAILTLQKAGCYPVRPMGKTRGSRRPTGKLASYKKTRNQ